MKLQDFAWLADENIAPDIVSYLREKGILVKTVTEEGLEGTSDLDLLALALAENRIIVTQDSDFGTMIYQNEIDFVGIVYLRPGHFFANFHIQTLETLFEQVIELNAPFVLVAENKPDFVKIRIRQF
jgi:predicted nuclease of predicted toxin-antitoxin system